MHPLSNVHLWHLFRLLLEGVFGLYGKRMAMMKELGFLGTESVLDVGCGIGEFATMTTGYYLGLDLDPQYVSFAQKHHPGKEFRCADVTNLAKDGASFECCFLVDVIHHLSDEQVRKLFVSLAHLTSRRLYVFDPVRQSPKNRIGRWIVAHDRGHHIRSSDELVELLDKFFVINTIRDSTTWPVEGICVVAQPRRSGTEDSP